MRALQVDIVLISKYLDYTASYRITSTHDGSYWDIGELTHCRPDVLSVLIIALKVGCEKLGIDFSVLNEEFLTKWRKEE